jgi:chloramphenicol O-acetyltransferase type A
MIHAGFTPVDLNSWKRGEIFYYFSQMAPTGYSLTVEIDVTDMRKTLKELGIKFFPAYLWLVTKAINKQPEFKMAIKDGKLGYFDSLTPLYASFHDDDKTFSLMWTEYDDDFNVFYERYLENKSLYSDNHGVLAQKKMVPPENAYTVSCIPWVAFSHFAVHSYENKPYFFPSVESGKFIEREGKLYMPLSITCHHATTDGYHVNLFIDTLQDDANNVEKYINAGE